VDRDHRDMDEMTALAETLERVPADAPTACAGWVAHDLMAHLAAGAAEMADLIDGTLADDRARPTRDMRDREAPFVAMGDDTLRSALRAQSGRLVGALMRLAQMGDDATVAFAGRASNAATLALHGRSEAALHRWDLVGTDATSRELLAQPELTAHGVVVLNEMLDGSPECIAARSRRAGVDDLHARLASPGQPDVVIVADDHGAHLWIAEPDGDPTVVADPATRLLMLWGRRHDPARVSWIGPETVCAQVCAVLEAPYRNTRAA
jgi:uncharacterized protein (TIGR03083 family)